MNRFIYIGFLISLQMQAQHEVPPATGVSFNKIVLLNQYISEGAVIGDIDNDGNQDIIAGSLWWKGPDFKELFSIAPVKTFPITGPGLEGYATNFFSFTDFIDNDDSIDLLQVGLPGTESYWIHNPGKNSFDSLNSEKELKKNKAQAHICNESPQFLNIIGDSKKELLAISKGKITLGLSNDSGQEWKTLAISHHDPKRFPVYMHGLGAGDINMDGRMDILEKSGWWEQPENWELKTTWKFHSYQFSPDQGGSQMYAYDMDGDGDNDVLTSMNAHAYGLSWYEQIEKNGEISFIEHQIMENKDLKNPYGISFSQLHAIALADFDNDGIEDFVTGKCFYAHNGHDPGGKDPAVLYWFKTQRRIDGTVDMIPYLIDDNSGVGRQISTGDLNKDGKMDIVVSNKKGVFAFVQK